MQQQTNNIIGAGAGSAGAASLKKIPVRKYITFDDLVDHSKSNSGRFRTILYEYMLSIKPLAFNGECYSKKEWIDRCLLPGELAEAESQGVGYLRTCLEIAEESVVRVEERMKKITEWQSMHQAEYSLRNDKSWVEIHSKRLLKIVGMNHELVKIYKFDMIKKELLAAILFHPSKVEQIEKLENGDALSYAYLNCKSNEDAREMFEKIMSCPVK